MPATWPAELSRTDDGGEGTVGPAGPEGPQGPRGFNGAPGQGFTYYGNWSHNNQYSKNDTCTYDGTTYLCWYPSGVGPSEDPPVDDPQHWSVFARKGDPGDPGPAGEGLEGQPGQAGQAGEDGQPGTQIVPFGEWTPEEVYDGVGTSYLYVVQHEGKSYIGAPNGTGIEPGHPSGQTSWTLIGEKGDPGEPGEPGPQGDQGPEGPEGPQGAEGSPGAAGEKGDTGPGFEKLRRGTAKWYLPFYVGTTGNRTLPGQSIELCIFDVGFPCRITAMACNVVGVVAGLTLRGLIYEDSEGWPGDLLWTPDTLVDGSGSSGYKQPVITGAVVTEPRRLHVGWHNLHALTGISLMGLASGAAIMDNGPHPGATPAAAGGWAVQRVTQGTGASPASMKDWDPAGNIGWQAPKTWLKLEPI